MVLAQVLDMAGNTSACAEKSVQHSGKHGAGGKYLRVRGEEYKLFSDAAAKKEIPPRARRRELAPRASVGVDGNTSACAEKRELALQKKLRSGKYLRVRGEERPSTRRFATRMEIPPRARRRVVALV